MYIGVLYILIMKRIFFTMDYRIMYDEFEVSVLERFLIN